MNLVRGNMTQYAWNYPWSSAKAHTWKKYNIIELSNIKEYIGECSWKDFLLKEESSEDIKIMRESTKYWKMAERIDLIQKLEAKLKIKLLRKAQGRPKKE